MPRRVGRNERVEEVGSCSSVDPGMKEVTGALTQRQAYDRVRPYACLDHSGTCGAGMTIKTFSDGALRDVQNLRDRRVLGSLSGNGNFSELDHVNTPLLH